MIIPATLEAEVRSLEPRSSKATYFESERERNTQREVRENEYE